jgi:hypothetical protein
MTALESLEQRVEAADRRIAREEAGHVPPPGVVSALLDAHRALDRCAHPSSYVYGEPDRISDEALLDAERAVAILERAVERVYGDGANVPMFFVGQS